MHTVGAVVHLQERPIAAYLSPTKSMSSSQRELQGVSWSKVLTDM